MVGIRDRLARPQQPGHVLLKAEPTSCGITSGTYPDGFGDGLDMEVTGPVPGSGHWRLGLTVGIGIHVGSLLRGLGDDSVLA